MSPSRAKPFLKWAGGKGQLIPAIAKRLPDALAQGSITTYIEPFIGSGAVFFYLAQLFHFETVILQDRNPDLILAYHTVRSQVDALIQTLTRIQSEYLPLAESERSEYYYATRSRFNETTRRPEPDSQASVERTAQLIFLNRTGFNGLFRVNSKGVFNVPFGRYARPKICDGPNLKAVSKLLANAELVAGDFNLCQEAATEMSFFYLDPPYRPLNRTASFNHYAGIGFDDSEQERLADFYRACSQRGAALMLSNSDPTNTDPDDRFFDDLYAGFHIERVPARRVINSKASARGLITELLITNY
jgi:DNA adenine methylase